MDGALNDVICLRSWVRKAAGIDQILLQTDAGLTTGKPGRLLGKLLTSPDSNIVPDNSSSAENAEKRKIIHKISGAQ